MSDDERFSLTKVEGKLWLAVAPTGLGKYDFEFENYFRCSHPFRIEQPVSAIARMGAANDYAQRFERLRSLGIELVHSPSEYERTSDLRVWYPLLKDVTPRSIIFNQPPSIDQIESSFGWPVFIKGIRQTSRHQRKLSVIESREQFDEVMNLWLIDPILAWQPIVVREFLSLHPVTNVMTHVIQPSFEFRSFWWRGQCVGFGPYWTAFNYAIAEHEVIAAIELGTEVARRIGVAFLVIDLAQDSKSRWHVIEINDGQDSGYAGVDRLRLWRAILDVEN